ncbi:MAG: MCE family protein [Deltaproteobacteria bacterium]|nr:MCE family protein [Deltaproteobacteria bacterium]
MKAQNELHAGIFILITLTLFALSIWILGQERQVFAKQEEFKTSFKDIQGLSKGAPVRLGGISVGRVSGFGFEPDSADGRVEVSFLVNDNYLDRITDGVEVSIQTQGLLGDKFLSLSSASPKAAPLSPGSKLSSRDASDMTEILAKANNIVDNSVEITEALKDFLKNFDKETITSLSSGIKSLGSLAKEIEDGKGLLHRLVFSKKDGDEIMNDIKAASESMREVSSKVKDGKGLLHALVYDENGAESLKTFADAAKTISTLSESLNGVVTEIKDGDGVLHDLVYAKSPEGFDQLLVKLNETITNLNVASEALARGSGTIGALLVDSQLYDNLVEVTDGAKRSFLLRQAIRNSLDK